MAIERQPENKRVTTAALDIQLRTVLGHTYQEFTDSTARIEQEERIRTVFSALSQMHADQFGRVLFTRHTAPRSQHNLLEPVPDRRAVGFLVLVPVTEDIVRPSGDYLVVLHDKESAKAKILVVRPEKTTNGKTVEDIYSPGGQPVEVHGDDPVDNFANEYTPKGMVIEASSDDLASNCRIEDATNNVFVYIGYRTFERVLAFEERTIQQQTAAFGRKIDAYVVEKASSDEPVIEE